MRRSILLIPLVLILVAAAAFWWWTRPRPVLTIVTWAGPYGRAQAAAQILPYGVANRVDARIAQWEGKLDDLRQWVRSGQYGGDVVDMELPAAVTACREGLLEPIDAATLPPGEDGTPAARDFHAGAIGGCHVASALYAQMLVCATPCSGQTLQDIFAALRADGRIALQRAAKVNLEMALLADGATAKDVYPLLETDAGIARAFAVLDRIKRNIAWGSSGEALRLLRGGQVRFATALTADIQAAPGVSLSSYQFTEADVLAIPKGNPKKERALDYIRFATGSAPLAGMVKFAPYMPPRRSSLALVEKLPASPTRDFVLAQKDMTGRFFAIDDAWWAAHGAALEARFRDWLLFPS